MRCKVSFSREKVNGSIQLVNLDETVPAVQQARVFIETANKTTVI